MKQSWDPKKSLKENDVKMINFMSTWHYENIEADVFISNLQSITVNLTGVQILICTKTILYY